MNRHALRLLMIAALCAVAPAHAAAPPAAITHEAAERKSTVTIRLGQQVTIALPGHAETNHAWRIVSNDPRIARSLGEPKPATTAAAKGAEAKPGAWEVAFVGNRPGRSIVRFVWTRVAQSDEGTHEEYREVIVRVE